MFVTTVSNVKTIGGKVRLLLNGFKNPYHEISKEHFVNY
jgi:hypothetical protein